MTVAFECPACGKRGQAPASDVGLSMRCSCGAEVRMVFNSQTEAEERPRQSPPEPNTARETPLPAHPESAPAAEKPKDVLETRREPPPIPGEKKTPSGSDTPPEPKPPSEKKPAPPKKAKREPLPKEKRDRLLVSQRKLRITTVSGDVIEGMIPDESWIEETIVRLRLTQPYTYKNIFAKREDTLPRGGMLRIALSAIALVEHVQ